VASPASVNKHPLNANGDFDRFLGIAFGVRYRSVGETAVSDTVALC
jgi:hypothetical protein